MSKKVHVILTGGVGSRLWPLSRKSNPKQYIRVFSEHSLFEQTIIRNLGFSDRILVVGNVNNASLSEMFLRDLKVKNADTITESVPRNTAAAIAFAAFASDPEDVLLITPSDHVIDEELAYKESITKAMEIAEKGYIVTFGIKPSKPETGYGYIEHKGEDVIAFREKPNQETAREFLSRGNFLWNSGMFCFKSKVFMEELKKYVPKVYDTAKDVWSRNEKGMLDEELSLKIPSISVDYAVMERSAKIKVVESHFKWSDLGSFESVYDYLVEKGYQTDSNGNMVIGSEKYTAFIGLSNTIFINTPDAHLILTKENSQEVKEIYSSLEINNPSLVE